MMAFYSTGIVAKGVLHTSFVVQNFVDDAFVEKGFQRAINCYPVEVVLDLLFDIAMRQGVVAAKEKVEDFLSAGRRTEPVSFEKPVRRCVCDQCNCSFRRLL